MPHIDLSGDVRNKITYGFSEDAYRVTEHNTTAVNINAVDSYAFIKDLFSMTNPEAHRDFIQLIPTRKGETNSQYSLAKLNNFTAKFCSCISSGHLQGFFCSDGLLENIIIQNNIIQTKSEHHITLNGCLSGHIQGNVDEKGEPSRVALYPARIGGNANGVNVWVTSFANTHEYGIVEGSFIKDFRRVKKVSSGNVYLDDFDYLKFRKEIKGIEKGLTTKKFTFELQQIAVKCGIMSS